MSFDLFAPREPRPFHEALASYIIKSEGHPDQRKREAVAVKSYLRLNAQERGRVLDAIERRLPLE